MDLILGTGHPWLGIDGNMTPFPLLGLILTLLLIRFVLRQPIGIIAAAVSIALGTVFSTLADTWGLTVTFSVWFISAMALSAGRARGAFGGRPPD
jgi:hypothetical protein